MYRVSHKGSVTSHVILILYQFHELDKRCICERDIYTEENLTSTLDIQSFDTHLLSSLLFNTLISTGYIFFLFFPSLSSIQLVSLVCSMIRGFTRDMLAFVYNLQEPLSNGFYVTM